MSFCMLYTDQALEDGKIRLQKDCQNPKPLASLAEQSHSLTKNVFAQ